MDIGERCVKDSSSFKTIGEMILADKFFHATMLINPDIDYLLCFSKVLAKTIICENKKDFFCDTCNACVKIKNGVHPDILVYGVDKPLDAEGVDSLIESCSLSPYEGDKKVYILANADDYSPVVLNKLLKTLEEPPQKVVFILLVKSEYKVLQTILSRCQKYFLNGFSVAEVERILKDEPNANIIAVESLGQLRRARKLVKEGGAEGLLDLVYSTLSGLKLTSDLIKYEKLFEKNILELQTILDLFVMVIDDAIKIKSNQRKLIKNKSGEIKIEQSTMDWSVGGLCLVVEACNNASKMKDAMVTSQNIVDQFLLKILEVRRKCVK